MANPLKEIGKGFKWFGKNVGTKVAKGAIFAGTNLRMLDEMGVPVMDIIPFMHWLKVGTALVEAGGPRGKSPDERRAEALKLTYEEMGKARQAIPEVPPQLQNLLLEMLISKFANEGIAKFDVEKAAKLIRKGVDPQEAVEKAS